jgi:subtilisin-like proprotein convertase family protein
VGISSELVIPDKGVADAVAVAIDVKNTDISAVEVFLYDPTGGQYVLYSKSGKKGESLKVTYPDPTKPVSGNLAGWAGKNPAGAWRIRVVDKAFLNNTVDGTVTWSVRTRTAGCP